MSARTLTNVVNDQTVTLNALIYGYAGHSLVTPQHALQQVWWTEERINEKVTRDFVSSRLQLRDRERLNQPVAFGDLSDDSYIEWILEKARRLFLVLAEIGEAEKIFAVVDKSWDDDDLPLELDDIAQLDLSNRRDNHANTRFYNTQFTFLLRELREGVHIDFAPNEEVPLEHVMNLPVAVSLQGWVRVHVPKRANEIYMRRKFNFNNSEPPEQLEQDFIMDVASTKMVEHEHIAPVWASYTHKGFGYTMSSFVGHHTLRTFFDHRTPAQYQKLQKPERRWLVLNWMHCLAETVATLHQNGFCHSAIRPANILVDEQNNIALSEIGSLGTFQKDKKYDPMEAFVYSAPEAHVFVQPLKEGVIAPDPTIPASRHASMISSNSVGSSNSSASQRSKLTKSPTPDFGGFNFGFRKTKPPQIQRSRIHETEKADIFSLGCVFLELITFMLKKKPHDFVKHRSSKIRVNAGGRNRTDSSFHANLDKVESWMFVLENLSNKHEDDAFRAVPHLLQLIRSMLTKAPAIRLSARDIRDRIYEILMTYTSIPGIHCGDHSHDVFIAQSTASDTTRASSAVSLRTMSTMSTMSSNRSLASSDASSEASDTDTIRMTIASSIRVDSTMDGFSDWSTLDDFNMDDDDGASIMTLEAPAPLHLTISHQNSKQMPELPKSPSSPPTPINLSSLSISPTSSLTTSPSSPGPKISFFPKLSSF